MTPSPKAIRHFGLAALEARAARTRQATAAPPTPPPVSLVWTSPPAHRPPVMVRLWLPVTPLFLLLSPFPILAIPLLYLIPIRGMNWAAAVFAVGRVLLATGGMDIDVKTQDAIVRLKFF
ncbi:hypothetical protein [Phenylobacterium sp.]|uniref:hypothetical protein n=1 Tax=Phenylobacterium sp. TaxID=1871053 RepID=UPI0012144638|nr:hypothetical protein [Phenylobacterium sp.]THD57774.1 MAG: hypothetical protein E8A49_21445 [Phenylobacterium sp.]